ncbi:hypothetical protein ASF36_23765 [Methylobacterium sp. Leaf90]|nr:hypothetical protein ASF36_23765 [Methylobacterium sp. Leaf90]
MGKTKKPIDWTAIERDYTKTSLPVRELARWYNCDEKAIRLRAKAGGWLRPGQESSAAPPQAPQPLDALVAPIVERLREMAPDDPAQTPDIVERARRVRDTDIATYRQQTQLELNRTGGAFSRFDATLQSQIIAAARGSVSAEIIAAIVGKESSGDANVGYSKILGENGRPSSAYGLGQITRGTAEEAARLGYLPQGFDRTNVATMAEGIAGVLQMKSDQNGGDLSRGIMAYRGSNDPSVMRPPPCRTPLGTPRTGSSPR